MPEDVVGCFSVWVCERVTGSNEQYSHHIGRKEPAASQGDSTRPKFGPLFHSLSFSDEYVLCMSNNSKAA